MNYIEEQPWGFTCYESTETTSFRTKYQRVEFITNPYFGRMLFLDGILQSSTVDEHIYHKALVSAGMNASVKRVLIAGGAEGAVAREVFQWPVEEVVMVDWDSELVEHCCEVEKFNVGSFLDRRLSYIGENIMDYCSRDDSLFDTIFIDLLDIDTEDDLRIMMAIVEKCKKRCKRGGTIVMNVGRDLATAQGFGEPIQVVVPSFQEPWYLAVIPCQ